MSRCSMGLGGDITSNGDRMLGYNMPITVKPPALYGYMFMGQIHPTVDEQKIPSEAPAVDERFFWCLFSYKFRLIYSYYAYR